MDSTHYIEWLRNRTDFAHLLESWIRSQSLFICGIIRAEVIRGIISPKQRRRVEEFFELIPEIPTDSKIWNKVSDLAWRMDREGMILPLSDLIIAACAMRVGATVITLDQHFHEIPGLEYHEDLP